MFTAVSSISSAHSKHSLRYLSNILLYSVRLSLNVCVIYEFHCYYHQINHLMHRIRDTFVAIIKKPYMRSALF